MKAARLLLLAAGCFGLGIFVSCEEALPPYNNPRDVLSGSLRGQYLFSATANRIRIDFFVVNKFDETFQAKAIMKGELTITMRRKPQVRKTVSLGPSDIASGRYDAGTQILTMDPGDTVRLSYVWDYTDDSFRDLRTAEFSYVSDPACALRGISLEEAFDLRGTVKVYDKVDDVSAGPVEFDLCHVSSWVDPKICVSIRPEEACKFLP